MSFPQLTQENQSKKESDSALRAKFLDLVDASDQCSGTVNGIYY